MTAGPSTGILQAARTKHCAILFGDVVGYFVQARDLKPLEAAAFLVPILRVMSDAVAAANGQVVRVFGDALLAVFVPEARLVSASSRACEAAEALQKGLARIGQQARIGINAGRAAFLATPWPGNDPMLIGRMVDEAAFLHRVANPGEIVVGRSASRALRPTWHLSPPFRVALKGLPDTIVGARVLGRRARA